MSDREASGLGDVAAFQFVLGQAACEGVLVGILLPIALIAIYNLVGRGLKGCVPRIITLIIVLVMLASSVILFSTDLTLFILLSSQLLSSRHDRPERRIAQLLVVSRVFTRLNYFIGDLIVAWRAWVLAKHRVIRVSLLLLLLVTFACYLAESVLTIEAAFTEDDGNEPPILTLIPIIPLLVVNAFSTGVIGYTTWEYRAQIKVHLQNQTRKNKVEQVLFLIIESGLLYCLIWIFSIVFGADLTSSTIPSQVVQVGGVAPYIATIFPTAIIVLVDRNKPEDTLRASNTVNSEIQFAPVSGSPISIVQSIANHLVSIKPTEISPREASKEQEPIGTAQSS